MPTILNKNVNIYYEEIGSGEPLLLIMGLGASLKVWEPHSNEFQKHFRCILVDNRGAGKSDKPVTEYTTDMMADDMFAVLDSLGIESTYIAGISMGSAIAQQMSISHPHRVKGLVLVSSWAYCDAYTKELFNNFIVLRKVLSPVDFTKYLQWIIYSPFYYNLLVEDLRKGALSVGDEYMPFEAFASQCAACANHNTENLLETINIPTLITVGDKDIFTPLRFSKYINERIKNSKIVIFENAGHVHHFEELNKFNEIVVKFLLNLKEGR